MPLVRSRDGVWSYKFDVDEEADIQKFNEYYLEALPRYMTALDPAFTCARETCEFEFLLSLFRVRGVTDPGWDPYETTLRAIPALCEVHDQTKNFEAARHLQLWTYGHILEASEPYEIIANLIDVAKGGRFKLERFPYKKNGRPQSPGEKINSLTKEAEKASIPGVATPLHEIWNRDLRNAIFHADYSIHGGVLRTIRPTKSYTHDEVMTLVNKALAYHEALGGLYRLHISSYKEPKIIDVSPGFSPDPEEHAVVIVRAGYGAAGIKDAWSKEQLAVEKIPHRIGRFTIEEIKLLNQNRTLALLPPSR